MGDPYYQRKIESEMDRFEQEISSLGPPAPNNTMSRSFIPAQLRRPMLHQQQHGSHSRPPIIGHPLPPGTNSPNAIPLPPKPRPSPVIISGAPQVYSANATTTNASTINKPPSFNSTKAPAETISAAPQLNIIGPSSGSSTSSKSEQPGSSGGGGVGGSSSSSIGIISKAPAAAGSSTSTGISPVKMLENPKASMISSAVDAEKKKKKKKKKKDDKDKKPKKALRSAGGQVWEDLTLQDWDPNGFRLFCGDLGNDVTDEVLTRVFGRYPSFQKAKVVRDKRSNKTKGFGFVSFKEPNDFVRAIKELDGRYVGSRPIKLRKSNWRARNIEETRKREKERNHLLTVVKK